MKPTITYKELILNEDFYQWVKFGKNSGYWRQWIADHPENEEPVNRAREVILHLHISSDELSDREIDLLWSRIEHTNKKTAPGTRPLYWGLRIAATLLLIALFAFTLTMYLRDHDTQGPALVTKSNPKGQKSTFHLPDGSTVTLNSGSELTYSSTFGETGRNVELTGEAFFEVRKDPARPFTVTTHHLKTTVLGTTFNVSAYPEQDQVAVMLATGKVSVTGLSEKLKGHRYVLNPGQQLVYTKDQQKTEVSSFLPEQALGWKDGILSFTDTPMNEVLWRLEMWYDVKITMKIDHAEEYHFTGKFKNQSLDHVLEGISYSFGFRYDLNNTDVTIYQ